MDDVHLYQSLVKCSANLHQNERHLEKKLRLKPWITNGLLKSIRNKNKMFNRLQNHHNNLALNEKYEEYRNTLNRSLRLAKQNHYHNILNEHKGNSKKVWEVTNELAFDK